VASAERRTSAAGKPSADTLGIRTQLGEPAERVAHVLLACAIAAATSARDMCLGAV
jgi:hypothetical protein